MSGSCNHPVTERGNACAICHRKLKAEQNRLDALFERWARGCVVSKSYAAQAKIVRGREDE